MSTHPSSLRSIGQTHKGFRVVRLTPLPELQCLLYELVHEPSGAQVLHIENKDSENLFCLSFQTLPMSSNGAAHILEHTLLCGSKKFPVKDPFFAMSRRSLNTFMNALTGADFTCYPAASEIHQDFYNLLEVYLDAVFHPLLEELSFAQEGHRLEFSDPLDRHSSLEQRGIVYNEMKGALSSPTARLMEALNEALFPDVTYGRNSGGDPKEIPQLTYDELKQFHQTFYHPSRCLFFFYGNMPLEGHLDFIAQRALNGVLPAPPLPPLPLQPRFSAPVARELAYPSDSEEDSLDRALIAFGWLTCPLSDQDEVLALHLLQIMLMDTDASPLKGALLRSGLCKQAHSFIDVEIHEIPWGITLKGCRPEDADALEGVLRETLQTICARGFSLESIENAIHQLEFHRSEITGDHAPFGLSLFMRSGLLKQHGIDPAMGLRVHSPFDRLRQIALADPDSFSRLIRRYLLDNPHRVRLVMRPDASLGEQEEASERARLDSLKACLTDAQREAIVEQAAQLSEFQKRREESDEEVLPKLALKEIPLGAKDYPLIREETSGLTVFHHRVFTNGLLYADLVFDLPRFSESDLPYLRLFMVALTQVGCASRSYQENLEYIQGNTGGIGAGLGLNVSASDPSRLFPSFHLRGKALDRKAFQLFSLLRETMTAARIESLDRLKEIVFKHFVGLESALNQLALKYAIHASASCFSASAKMADALYGLGYYRKVRTLVKNFDQEGPYLLSKLQEVQERIAHGRSPHLVLACDGEAYDRLKTHHFYGVGEIESAPFTPWTGCFSPAPAIPRGWVIASPVAFIGKASPALPYTHPDAPALSLAASLFDHLTLHPQIRERGGAYGGGATHNPMAGIFHFYSHRDPHIASSLQAFQEAIARVFQGRFDDSDLERAKFEVVQGLSSPIAPGSRADVAYGWYREGRSLVMRQAFRHKLLSMGRDQVIGAVERTLWAPLEGDGGPVVFAGKELLERENRKLASEQRSPLEIESV